MRMKEEILQETARAVVSSRPLWEAPPPGPHLGPAARSLTPQLVGALGDFSPPELHLRPWARHALPPWGVCQPPPPHPKGSREIELSAGSVPFLTLWSPVLEHLVIPSKAGLAFHPLLSRRGPSSLHVSLHQTVTVVRAAPVCLTHLCAHHT